ncbi:hypothetical protein MKY25_15675 [Geobacillus sp. FSL W8-0032]|uniref:Uncharacterized protein n=1 Tax=Geobacillus icigianus TaxID=1430331 RepID=A0ABU6BH06_9BACL|nr:MULTISPECIES: hypothetical protein [Geobacillus]MEB3751181.1 hypothetical protein [Geobacillus icigianus]
MLYNYFVSGTGVVGVAKQIADVIVRKFNITGTVTDLINSLVFKLKVIYRAHDGDFSWRDLGGAILDLGQLILTFVPAGKLTAIVSALWDIATIL